MACGCGQSVRGRQAIQTAQSVGAGSYPLYTFRGCTQLHAGPYQGRSIYVVARGDDRESLFAKDKLAEAASYAREVRAQIENLPTAALCDDAVVAVYG